MKIGILTFHRAHNYGAVLQAFALQEVLKEINCSVEIIDYRQPYIEKIYKSFNLQRILSKNPIKLGLKCHEEIFLIKKRKQIAKIFSDFREIYLQISHSSINKINDFPIKYDVIIHGSDQIWNKKLTGGYDSIFLGGYNKLGDSKIIAYAASMELIELNNYDNNILEKNLEKFSCISVRETAIVNLLQPLVRNKIVKVVDPTILADASIWDKILIKPRVTRKYVLVYQNGLNEKTHEIANDIAQQIGASVIIISSWANKNDTNKNYATPGEFVGLIKYAACIVTTSFHGTTLSIVFKRPFYSVISGEKSDIRFSSILDDLNLTNRLIKNGIAPSFSEIDYSTILNQLNEMKQYSEKFLKNSLIQSITST